jgi:hypothetical protein
MITFGPGFCAVETIAKDLNIPKWWPEPECLKKPKELGLIIEE